jgi:hypothetical protein
MKTGTKSLLFGVHQIFWHPITVILAWRWLYRSLPSLKEVICIIVHDWGYWGKINMDDEEGEKHPELGAMLAHRLFDRVEWYPCLGYNSEGNNCVDTRFKRTTKYLDLCLYHSRHYARNAGVEPSPLCWADKLSIIFEPWWLYLPRAWASGELAEYRKIAAETGFIPLTASHRDWYRWIQDRLATLGREKRGDVVPYVNPKRNIDRRDA